MIDWTLVAAFIVGTIAVSRAARLVVDDDWPPIMDLRAWYVSKCLKMDDEGVPQRKTGQAWAKLIECGFCVSVYFAAFDTAAWMVAYFVDWVWLWWVWWVPNVFLASAYLAGIINGRDLPPE